MIVIAASTAARQTASRHWTLSPSSSMDHGPPLDGHTTRTASPGRFVRREVRSTMYRIVASPRLASHPNDTVVDSPSHAPSIASHVMPAIVCGDQSHVDEHRSDKHQASDRPQGRQDAYRRHTPIHGRRPHTIRAPRRRPHAWAAQRSQRGRRASSDRAWCRACRRW